MALIKKLKNNDSQTIYPMTTMRAVVNNAYGYSTDLQRLLVMIGGGVLKSTTSSENEKHIITNYFLSLLGLLENSLPQEVVKFDNFDATEVPPHYQIGNVGTILNTIPFFIDLREKPDGYIHWGTVSFYGNFLPVQTGWDTEFYDNAPALYYYNWRELNRQGAYATIPVYILNLVDNKKYIMTYPLENDWDRDGYWIYGSEGAFNYTVRQEDW